MLTPEESAELRILHAKAYGRDGKPSKVELARLRELERRRRGVVAAASDMAAEPVAASDPPADTTPVAASEPRHPRRRWLVVGAAAILAIGVAVGWGVSANTRGSVPLTDEQRGWQDALAAEDYYDVGSFRAVSADDEVGVVVCLIMGNGDKSSAKCLDSDAVRSEGIWLDLQAPTDDAGIFTVTTATLVFTPDGQPAAATNSFFNSPSGNTVYEPKDQAIFDALVERGYQQSSLWIVGYFEDHPVWIASRADAAGEQCLVYAAAADASTEVCAPWSKDSASLMITVNPDSHHKRVAQIDFERPSNGSQYLTITVHPVSDVTVDPETGDVIEFTVDEPSFDDLALDDKTGK
ncbi:hypothetical protein DC31_17075 [Microbacterium sp. CH12i]|uniref:hypothetical protein n=1 Tax=Microbacterium sp. CH12i TaxID=1479651 RepID=UPI00046102C1|nr:hypothetical protein [Microbacterium sp. CH12i]KDA05281.1 hypothetical protein DC31_17075 [Microbacterium sp. CH12i]